MMAHAVARLTGMAADRMARARYARRMGKGWAFLAAFTAVLVVASAAHAADCTNPSKPEGSMVYNSDYHTMQFCNGTSWVAMGGVWNVPWQASGTAVYYNNGFVGIGTASPPYRFIVHDGTDRNLHIRADDFSGIGSGMGFVSANDANSFVQPLALLASKFYIGGGNVGIGTNNPGSRLEIKQESTNQGSGLRLTRSDTAGYSNILTGGNNYLYLFNADGNSCYLYAGGWGCSSDARLKNHVAPLAYGLAEVARLKPVFFEWKNNPGKRQVGFLAQEVKGVLPELVGEASDTSKTLGVAYASMAPVLVKAIQELKADNDNLRALVEKQGREFEAYRAAHP